jgi:hypothetical protein
MQLNSRSRAARWLCAATWVCFGLQAVACGDDVTADVPDPTVPSPSTTPVPGCPDPQFSQSADNLMRQECDGTDSMGNPTMFPPGAELTVRNNLLRKCPDDGQPRAANTPFQLFWTICNISDNAPTVLLPYKLDIFTVTGMTETLLRSIDFGQPPLDACECTNAIVVFNSQFDPNLEKKLGSGTFRFKLSGSTYASVTPTDVVINP